MINIIGVYVLLGCLLTVFFIKNGSMIGEKVAIKIFISIIIIFFWFPGLLFLLLIKVYDMKVSLDVKIKYKKFDSTWLTYQLSTDELELDGDTSRSWKKLQSKIEKDDEVWLYYPPIKEKLSSGAVVMRNGKPKFFFIPPDPGRCFGYSNINNNWLVKKVDINYSQCKWLLECD